MITMCSLLLATAIAILLPIMISAECQCTASGDPHYVMCDKQTRFDFQAEGLFTAFKSDDLEVQVFQAMAKDKPVSYVDYCSIKFVKDDCQFVMKTRSIKEPNNVIMNGEKIVVSNAPAFISKEIDKNLGITMDSNYDMVFKTKEGVVHVTCKPQQMIIRAPTTKICEGLCGDCSGKPQTKPVKPIQHACKETQQPSGSCKPKPAATSAPSTPPPTNATKAPTTAPSTPAPTNGTVTPTTPPPTTAVPPTTPPPTNGTSAPTTPPPTTKGAPAPTTPPPTNTTIAPTTSPASAPVNNASSAPTTAPANGTTAAPNTTAPAPLPIMNATSAPTMPPSASNATNNATSAPTTLPPVNASIAPPQVKEADKSQIVGHPVFESEEVMKKVINACMCGQPKERMEADKQFGGFVESCIYDKSLGPNEEDVAVSNMEVFLNSVTPMPTVTFNNDSAAAASVPVLPEITVIGNLSYSNANFDTSSIREKHVTRLPSEIHPTVGVSYKLRFTIPDEDVALIPQLMPRSQVFTGTGERSDPIMPSSAQQMAMIQYGMPVPSSLVSPTGGSMPASTASMPAPSASIPASGASSPMLPATPQGSSPATYLAPSLSRPAMGARPEERSGDRSPLADKFPSNSPHDDDNKLKVRFELEAPVVFSTR